MAPPPQSLMIPFDAPVESQLSSESSLAQQLLQITNQKGQFRNISEQSLLAEDSSSRDADGSESATAPAPAAPAAAEFHNTEETAQQRLEKLWASKESMTKQWSRGLDELLTSLDFLSLLLSKQSAAARANISEGLQAQRVPPGSLEAKVVQAQTPLASKVQRDAQVARGWKAKGFELAYSKFTAASARLKQEAEREALFWAETARLQEDGWKISRHPRDSKAIGIHIGMHASAPQFRSRGFDLLRQDEDGRVYLDQAGLSSQSAKRLHVAVEKQGRICGSTTTTTTTTTSTGSLAAASSTSTNDTISESAALARDSLLEEELFYEASREARLISKQEDIITRAQTITFSLDQESKVILSYGTHVPHTSCSLQTTHSHDDIAQGIRICLKSLFIEALEWRQASRTKKPSAITTRPRPDPELSILRPLIASTRHQAAIHSLQKGFVALFLKPFRRAGLDLDLHITSSSSSSSPDENEQINGQQGKLSPARLSHSKKNVSVLTLPDGNRKVNIQIESSLNPPIYGILYQTTEPVDFGFAKVAQLSLSKEDGFLEAVRRILNLSVVNVIKTAGAGSKPDTKGQWEVKMAHRGEMELVRRGANSKRVAVLRARVQVQPGAVWLSVASCRAKDLDAGTTGVVIWRWSDARTNVTGKTEEVGITGQQAHELSLLEVVSQLASS